MRNNFVILYTSREGSTAIIDALSKHRDVSVPIFEEMDGYWAEKINFKGRPSDELGYIFANNDFRLKGQDAFRKYVCDKRGSDVKSVGLKWRYWGKFSDTVRIFIRHNVRVYILYRRDPLELCASYYFSRMFSRRHNTEAVHNQFIYSQMNEQEKAAYRGQLEESIVDLEPMHFLALLGWRILRAGRNRMLGVRFKWSGIPVRHIYYEDFLEDPRAFLEAMLADLALDNTNVDDLLKAPKVRKVSRVSAQDRIEGFDRFRRNPLVQLLCFTYRGVVL
jgi:hypothetical protein